jgi:hypothetical protein
MSTSNMTRKGMIEYLTQHFRYYTMNSWNNSTSYAANVKIRNFVPRNLQDQAYALLECEDAYYEINDILNDFGRLHDWRYQIGFNGRSNGYLVLIQGGYEEKIIYKDADFTESYGYRAYADRYGWKSKQEAIDAGLHNKKIKTIFTEPGRGIDQGEDFADWETVDIKERVRLVKEFDKCVEDCKKVFIECCKIGTREEEYQVTKTRTVLNRED